MLQPQTLPVFGYCPCLHLMIQPACCRRTVKTFVHYAMGLLHVGLSSPVDILFLTAFVLKASSGHGCSLDVGQLGSMHFKLHCKA